MFVLWVLCVVRWRSVWQAVTCPEESYQMWCVIVCDQETSWTRRPWPIGGCYAKYKPTNMFEKINVTTNSHTCFTYLCLYEGIPISYMWLNINFTLHTGPGWGGRGVCGLQPPLSTIRKIRPCDLNWVSELF
jgi:hypothetical protein